MVRPFKIGERILVSGDAGMVVGEVLAANTLEEMPDLDKMAGHVGLSKTAITTLREVEVDFVLSIAYKMNDGLQVCFTAFRFPEGWRDLQGQKLKLAKVGPA